MMGKYTGERADVVIAGDTTMTLQQHIELKARSSFLAKLDPVVEVSFGNGVSLLYGDIFSALAGGHPASRAVQLRSRSREIKRER